MVKKALVKVHYLRRAPYGARGLKLNLVKVVVMMVESRPVWGAWIEISRGSWGITDGG